MDRSQQMREELIAHLNSYFFFLQFCHVRPLIFSLGAWVRTIFLDEVDLTMPPKLGTHRSGDVCAKRLWHRTVLEDLIQPCKIFKLDRIRMHAWTQHMPLYLICFDS